MALVDVIIGYAKGGQGDVGPQGPEGPQGPQGPQGPLPPLVNNALSTTPGVAALDAAMGKTLQDGINTTNSNLGNLGDIVSACMKYRKTVGKTENIFLLPAGIYTLLEGSNYFPPTLGNYGVLLIMPAEFNYATALYIDSGANVGFCFANLGAGTWNWTVLPHTA